MGHKVHPKIHRTQVIYTWDSRWFSKNNYAEFAQQDLLPAFTNEISYRGLTIKKDYFERNELEFKNIIQRLKEEANSIQ